MNRRDPAGGKPIDDICVGALDTPYYPSAHHHLLYRALKSILDPAPIIIGLWL